MEWLRYLKIIFGDIYINRIIHGRIFHCFGFGLVCEDRGSKKYQLGALLYLSVATKQFAKSQTKHHKLYENAKDNANGMKWPEKFDVLLYLKTNFLKAYPRLHCWKMG